MKRSTASKLLTAAAVLLLLKAGAGAHPPWGIAADGRGRVYFSALETVWRVDERGRLSVLRAGVEGRHTHELRLDEEGSLHGEDLTYEPARGRWVTALWKVAPSGEFTYTLAPTDAPPRGASIWRDASGSTYAVQSETAPPEFLLVRRDASGRASLLSGDAKSFERWRQVILYNLGGTAFGRDGALYFTDRASVYKLTREGPLATLARNVAGAKSSGERRGERDSNDDAPGARRDGGHGHASLLGLCVDADGNVYAADIGAGRVLKITNGGAVSEAHASERGWMPTGVAWAEGNLYVLEFGTTPAGTHTPPRVLKLAGGAPPVVIASVAEASPDATSGTDAAAASSSSVGAGGGGGGAAVYKFDEAPATRAGFVAYALACAAALTLALAAFVFVRRRRSRKETP